MQRASNDIQQIIMRTLNARILIESKVWWIIYSHRNSVLAWLIGRALCCWQQPFMCQNPWGALPCPGYHDCRKTRWAKKQRVLLLLGGKAQALSAIAIGNYAHMLTCRVKKKTIAWLLPYTVTMGESKVGSVSLWIINIPFARKYLEKSLEHLVVNSIHSIGSAL